MLGVQVLVVNVLVFAYCLKSMLSRKALEKTLHRAKFERSVQEEVLRMYEESYQGNTNILGAGKMELLQRLVDYGVAVDGVDLLSLQQKADKLKDHATTNDGMVKYNVGGVCGIRHGVVVLICNIFRADDCDVALHRHVR